MFAPFAYQKILKPNEDGTSLSFFYVLGHLARLYTFLESNTFFFLINRLHCSDCCSYFPFNGHFAFLFLVAIICWTTSASMSCFLTNAEEIESGIRPGGLYLPFSHNRRHRLQRRRYQPHFHGHHCLTCWRREQCNTYQVTRKYHNLVRIRFAAFYKILLLKTIFRDSTGVDIGRQNIDVVKALEGRKGDWLSISPKRNCRTHRTVLCQGN